jgi:hypothetical protein
MTPSVFISSFVPAVTESVFALKRLRLPSRPRRVLKLIQAMANSIPSGGGEHRVWIQANGGGPARKATAAPEMPLNRFVRFVTLIEKLGNAFGTLAFTWATVVLLGGYSKDLSLENDFWFSTVIVFLEATRYVEAYHVSTGLYRPRSYRVCIVFAYCYFFYGSLAPAYASIETHNHLFKIKYQLFINLTIMKKL